MAHCVTLWLTVSHCGSLCHIVAHCVTLWLTVSHCGSLCHIVAHCVTLWLTVSQFLHQFFTVFQFQLNYKKHINSFTLSMSPSMSPIPTRNIHQLIHFVYESIYVSHSYKKHTSTHSLCLRVPLCLPSLPEIYNNSFTLSRSPSMSPIPIRNIHQLIHFVHEFLYVSHPYKKQINSFTLS